MSFALQVMSMFGSVLDTVSTTVIKRPPCLIPTCLGARRSSYDGNRLVPRLAHGGHGSNIRYQPSADSCVTWTVSSAPGPRGRVLSPPAPSLSPACVQSLAVAPSTLQGSGEACTRQQWQRMAARLGLGAMATSLAHTSRSFSCQTACSIPSCRCVCVCVCVCVRVCLREQGREAPTCPSPLVWVFHF